MERREPDRGEVVFMEFWYCIFDSCPSCLVWSGLIRIICNAVVVFMLSYFAMRFVANF